MERLLEFERTYAKLSAAFYNSPGYQFSLSQGEGAINKQAAAGGSLYSSNTLGALNNYAQGTASNQYNNYISQLMGMAGMGNQASAGVGTAATATGQGVANSYGNIGNANANGILGPIRMPSRMRWVA